jgi:ribosomal-protein-alanine N-acetyltransferase
VRSAALCQRRAQQLFVIGWLKVEHGTNFDSMPLSFALTHDDVRLRLVRMRDAKVLEARLMENRAWLRPWEATSPYAPNSFDVKGMIRSLLRSYDDQTGIPFLIEYRGAIVGQINVANILHGSVSSAVVGYWVTPDVAGRGITPTAVALVSDYLFNVVGLHRVEIDIRPENAASLRVVQKLGFRYEGFKERFIHINGAWRDHMVFALTHEEVLDGVLNRWLRRAVPELTYPNPADFLQKL